MNVQPRAFAHHAFVASGSALASSVWVIQPYVGVGGPSFSGDETDDFREADRFFADFREADRFVADFREIAFLFAGFRDDGFFFAIIVRG